MTQPSLVLDAIVARLRAAFALTPDQQAHGARNVEVRAIDETSIADVLDAVTVPMPAVLVSCLAMPTVGRDYGPTTVNGQFIARCIAKRPGVGAELASSRGDVAMDMAGFVASVIDEEMWPDATGKPTVLARASRIAARNMGTRDLAQKGASMWVVSWEQQIELSLSDRNGVIRALRRFYLAADVEGGRTPDEDGLVELEGREP